MQRTPTNAADMTVLYTALPRLTHDLGVSASAKLWIVNIYALVVSGLLPGMGTLGDRLGPSACSWPARRFGPPLAGRLLAPPPVG